MGESIRNMTNCTKLSKLTQTCQFSRWDKHTFQEDYVRINPLITEGFSVVPEVLQKNCTVAFLRNDMGDTKCQKSCASMGATSYRWFDNGCCQCIGDSCVRYGIDQAKCRGSAFADIDSENNRDSDLEYLDLSDEELRQLEAEYGLLEDDEETVEETSRSPED